MKQILLLLLLLPGLQTLYAQDFSAYQKKTFAHGADILNYRILYPDNYAANEPYPLIVFLHGSGERGNDNALQLAHGGALFLKDSLRKQFQAIVIFPQCPADSFWSKFLNHKRDPSAENNTLNTGEMTTPEHLVKLLIDSLADNHIADKKRIYLGGLSLGGFGTYDLLTKYPHYFAAAFPICGQVNISIYTKKAADVPLWIFHGALDNVVNPQPDRDLFKALQAMGKKNVQYTEYPNADHNSWDSAFAEPGLLPWLFAQHL